MNRLRRAVCTFTCLLPLAAVAAPAAGVDGVVTQVIDGDTLVITPSGGTAFRVRLANIDAPEICQPWGEQARRALQELALNKPATLQGSAKGGAMVAAVVVDGVNLGPRLVEDGHAWSTRSRYDRGPLVKQERMAKALGRGLHATPGAISPQEWRRVKGACPAG